MHEFGPPRVLRAQLALTALTVLTVLTVLAVLTALKALTTPQPAPGPPRAG